jgi:periplasmic protein TonB
MISQKFNPNKIIGLIMALAATILLASCNNSDDTVTESANADSTNNPNATTTATVNAPTKKKTGKVTAAIKIDEETVKMEKDNVGYYNRTEIAPAYPGGQDALETYIMNNIEYPQQAIDSDIEGTVYVKFGVDEKGNVSNVTTVGNKIGYGLEEEAVKVVAAMPQWTAGTVKGKNVKTWRTLPITYKLES